MNIIERAKKIIIEPKNEWLIINQEEIGQSQLILTYLIPLSLIPAVASFIGFGLVGISIPFAGTYSSVSWGIKQAVISLLSTIGGALISAYIIDLLAPNFGAVKNFNKAFQLVVYSYTPTMIAGIFLIVPSISIISTLAGIYGLYLLYLGIQPLMQTPIEKTLSYFIVSLIAMVFVFVVLTAILASIIVGNIYY
jgi:hypothetical protein